MKQSWRLAAGIEPDFFARFFRRRLQKRQQFVVKIAQDGVVLQQRLVDLRQALQDRAVCREQLALLHERAYDEALIATAFGLFRTLAAMRAPVFSEGVGEIFEISTLFQGRRLRP